MGLNGRKYANALFLASDYCCKVGDLSPKRKRTVKLPGFLHNLCVAITLDTKHVRTSFMGEKYFGKFKFEKV